MARVSILSTLTLLLGALLFMVAQVQGAKGPIITNKVRSAGHPGSAIDPPCIASAERNRVRGLRRMLILQVYFDLEHGGKPIGRVVMGLYGK